MCDLGRGLDTGEKTREESGEAFGKEVGSNPRFMAEVIARQRRFMEDDIHCFCTVRRITWDLEDARDRGHGGTT